MVKIRGMVSLQFWPYFVVFFRDQFNDFSSKMQFMESTSIEFGLLVFRNIEWNGMYTICHDDVNKWKYIPRNWPFVRGIHRSPVNSPQKGQWRRALMFSLICVWINGWVNNREADDLRRYRAHHDVIVMISIYMHIYRITCQRELRTWQLPMGSVIIPIPSGIQILPAIKSLPS